LPIILLSGSNPAHLTEVQAAFPNVTVIKKPFAVKALLDTIYQANIGERNALPKVS
jgi:hypothetical protein